jgi:hypothetical protein
MMKIKDRMSIFSLLTVMLGSIYASPSFATSASCEPLNGSPQSYDNNMLEKMKATDNEVGHTYETAFNAGQESYQITCDCSPADATSDSVLILYTLKTPLPSGNTFGFQKLNDHMDVKTSIFIPKTAGAVSVPATKISDSTRHRDADNNGICSLQNTQDHLTTGSQGQLIFSITKPFIGQLDIPRTAVAEVYATSATSSTNTPKSTSPVAVVYISGTITVPQSCEINKGETIMVDFGYIGAGDMTKVKQPPVNYRANTFDIVYDCTQNGLPTVPPGNKLTMTLEGDDVVDQYYLVGRRRPSDNVADIGITVLNDSGTSIPFKSGILPMNQTGAGKVTLMAYPVNLVGGVLESGDFDASATLQIDIK